MKYENAQDTLFTWPELTTSNGLIELSGYQTYRRYPVTKITLLVATDKYVKHTITSSELESVNQKQVIGTKGMTKG